MVSPIASLSRMQQHNDDSQQQQFQSLSILKIPTPSLSTFSSQSTPAAATSSSIIDGGGGVYSIASCNNSPQLFTTERLRQMGVINKRAFCDICCTKFCNKYFCGLTNSKSTASVPCWILLRLHLIPPFPISSNSSRITPTPTIRYR